MQNLLLPLLLLGLAALVPAQDEAGDPKVDFQKQIRPILESHCTKCHGAKKQEGELRLDLKKFVFHAEEDLWSIVPGEPDFSPVYERIILPADDPDVMPAEGERLTEAQIGLIKAWIEQGAVWPDAADEELLALEARRRAREVIELPALDAGQQAAETAALAAVRGTGALAMRIAANTIAVEANFSLLGERIGDAELATLRGLEPTLVWLNLARTRVGDAGLAEVARFGQLRRLNLANTAVTDRGLEQIAKLGRLEYLNLYGTAVTDAGLAHLTGLAGLQKLYLWKTQVTDEGAAAFQKKMPGLVIDLGRAAEAMLAADAAAEKPINDSCPVTGKPVDPQFHSELDGKRVAFCCANCKAKFDADPAAFREKLGLATPAKPINDTCPVSGKPVDPAFHSEIDGKRVAFCCADCKAKFDAEPEAFRAKLGLERR
jgi:YHS domain-containing protein/mono/diheme cytochrome c family protein